MSIRRSHLRLMRALGALADRLPGVGRLRGTLGDERGSVLVCTVLMMPVVLGFLGLMLDGSLLYAARRELQDAADSAALAGAMQADLEWFAQTGKWRIAESTSLDGEMSAGDAVRIVCDIYGVNCVTTLPAEHQGMLLRVRAEGDFSTLFLHLLLGQRKFTISAEAAAILVPGY